MKSNLVILVCAIALIAIAIFRLAVVWEAQELSRAPNAPASTPLSQSQSSPDVDTVVAAQNHVSDVATASPNKSPSEEALHVRTLDGDSRAGVGDTALPRVSSAATGAYREYEFIRAKSPSQGVSMGQLHSQKNDVMEHLCSMNPPPDGLTDVLVALARDESQDSVTRDYALQHLTLSWFARERADGRDKVLSLVRDLLSSCDGGIAGTALLSMNRLARRHGSFERKEVQSAALAIAADEQATDPSRLTALQLCHSMELPGTIELAHAIARTTRSASLARIAAAVSSDLGAPVASRAPCVNCQ